MSSRKLSCSFHYKIFESLIGFFFVDDNDMDTVIDIDDSDDLDMKLLDMTNALTIDMLQSIYDFISILPFDLH